MERCGSIDIILGATGSIPEATGKVSGTTGQAAPRSARYRLCKQQRAGFALLLPFLCLTLALPTPGWSLPTPRYRLTKELSHSWELLAAVNASLHRLKELGTLGFECSLDEIDLEDITENQMNAIKACTSEDPETGNCPALERSTFDRSHCLQGIYKDLNTYRAELKNFNEPKVLAILDEMLETLGTSSRSRSMSEPSVNIELTFKERMRLCSILQAFQIRTVTINRLMNYLSSPESQ